MSTRNPLQTAAKPSGAPSPCNSICTMNSHSGFCNGCFRTLNEIATWGSMAETTKRQVWSELKVRRLAGH